MYIKLLFFLLISQAFSQDPQPTDSLFASQFVGIYQFSNDTSIQLENMKTYLKGVTPGGELFHFLWLNGDRFQVQNRDYTIEFKRQTNNVTGFFLVLPNRQRYFRKIQ